MVPFDDAEKELDFILTKAEPLVAKEHFTSMLKIVKLINSLARPSKVIERESSYPFLHKVFWSGLLSKSEDGSVPSIANILNTSLLLV